jgi:hypothetical protein
VSWRLSLALLPIRGALLSTALIALNPALIFYGTQVKPYAIDAAVAVVLLAAGAGLQRRAMSAARQALAGFGAGCLGWLSIPAVFGSGALGLALGSPWFLAGAAAGALPAMLHARFYAAHGPSLETWWAAGFLPWHWGLAPVTWLLAVPVRLVQSPLHWDVGPWLTAIGVGSLVAGGVLASRQPQGRRVILPFGLAFCAAVLHVYPLGGEGTGGGRVVLFLVPSLILMVSLGLTRLPRVWMAAIGGGLVLASAVWLAADPYRYTRDDMPAVLGYIRGHWEPGDRIYLHPAAEPEASFYRLGGLPESSLVPNAGRWQNPHLACCLTLESVPSSRVWLVYSYRSHPPVRGWEAEELAGLLRGARLEDRFTAGNSEAVLLRTGSPK